MTKLLLDMNVSPSWLKFFESHHNRDMGMQKQVKRESPTKKLSYKIAFQADMEMMKMGKVMIRCPECNEHPTVDRNSHRVIVQCPCGFVRMAEIVEI